MPLESATYINSLNVANPATTDAIGQGDDHIRMLKAVLKNTFPNINAACQATPLQMNQYFVPVGAIMLWYGNTSSIPTGWALCDGGTYNKASGSGTITAPDLRDVFVKGCGGSTSNPTATPVVNSTGGNKTHTHTVTNAGTAITKAMLPDYNLKVTESAHTHTITDPGHTHNTNISIVPGSLNYAVAGTGPNTGGAEITGQSNTTGITLASAKTNLTVALDGGGATHTHTATVNTPNHEPPYRVLAYIMKL